MTDPEEEQRIEAIAKRLKKGGWLPPDVLDVITDGLIAGGALIDWTAPMPEGNAVYDPVLEAIEILRQADQI